MKAKLQFNLPEEEQEFKDAVNGTLWKIVVQSIAQLSMEFRQKDYDNPFGCELQEKLKEMLEKYHLSDEAYL